MNGQVLKGPIEAALSTDLGGEPYNFFLWDIHTGTQLVAFKGNKSNPIANCLQIIDNNYFITVNDRVLSIWSIFNKKCQDQKLFLPGRPSTLCTSPCGQYIIVGISEMIYIWQLKSGNLLAHTQRHYQTVSVLRTNCDGTFFLSGGEDGMVFVWPFADLISNTHNLGSLNLKDESRKDVGLNEPRFSWQHHNGPVTDIHIASSNRCISTSIDATINIYNLITGTRLYSVTLPCPLWSVVMNKCETRIFLGGQDGNIYEVAISTISLSLNMRNKDDEPQKPMLTGHTDKVINLLLTIDGSTLVSASFDSTCKIWDANQKKMLREVKHQAPLANLTSILVPQSFALISMAQSLPRPPLAVKPLKRNIYKLPRDGSIMREDLFEESSTTIINVNNRIDSWNPDQERGNQPDLLVSRKRVDTTDSGSNLNDSDTPKVQNLKAKLKDLYILSAKKIFHNASHTPISCYKDIAEQDLSSETLVSNGIDSRESDEKLEKRKNSKTSGQDVKKIKQGS